MAMNKVEMDNAVKALTVEALIDVLETAGARKIDDYTYAFPVTVDGVDTYSKIAVTATMRKATKTNEAFDIDVAVAKYAAKLDERAEKAAQREATKAAKASKNA